jgi:hypothetical protein
MFRSQAQGDLSIFGNDPAAVIAVKVLGIFVIMVVMTLLTIGQSVVLLAACKCVSGQTGSDHLVYFSH